MKTLRYLFLILLLVVGSANATTYNIGPGQTYTTFAALVAAQTLTSDDIVDGGENTFRETWTPDGSGTSGHPVTLRNATIYGSTLVTTWDQTDLLGATGNLLVESFEGTGYENEWSETVGSGSVVGEDSTDVARPSGGGSQVLKIQKVSPNYDAITRYNFGSAQAVTYSQFYVRIAAEGLADDQGVDLVSADTGAYAAIWRIKAYQDSGALKILFTLYNNGTLNYYLSSAISTDTWYRVDIKYDHTGATWEWLIDGTSINNGSLTGTYRTGVQRIYLGDDSNSYTATAYLDLFQVSSTGYIVAATALPANCWKAALASSPRQVWFDESSVIAWGVPETTLSGVNAKYDFYFDSRGYLVTYSTTNPDAAFTGIEASQRDNGILASSKNYITIDNVEVAYTGKAGINNTTGSNFTLQNSSIHHIGPKVSEEAHGVMLSMCSNAIIKNNIIHNGGTHGIMIANFGGGISQNNLITANEIYDCYHSLIDIQNYDGVSDHHTIRKNILYNSENYGVPLSCNGIFLRAYVGYTLENVLIHNNVIHNIYSSAMQIMDYLTNITITNNTIYKTNALNTTLLTNGISVSGTDVTGVIINNNIIQDIYSGAGSGDKCLDVVDAASVSEIKNNCLYQAAGETRIFAKVGANTYHYDDLAAYLSDLGAKVTGTIFSNPIIVSSTDFHLAPGSPCQDTGVSVAGIHDQAGNTDFVGNKSPQRANPSIGAYEYIRPVIRGRVMPGK